jgi:hypothetical protein
VLLPWRRAQVETNNQPKKQKKRENETNPKTFLIGINRMSIEDDRLPDLRPAPIETWIDEETYIREQLEVSPVPNTNLKGMQCSIQREGLGGLSKEPKLTYEYSEFNLFSDYVKRVYRKSKLPQFRTSWPSMVSLFESDLCIQWPSMLSINSTLMILILSQVKKTFAFPRNNSISNHGQYSRKEAEFTRLLFQGAFDDQLQKEFHHERDSLSGLLARYTPTFRDLLAAARSGTPVCIQSAIEDGKYYHAVALLLFVANDQLTLAVYDPNYTIRTTSLYLWPTNTVYCFFKLLATQESIPLQFLNLSDLCIHSPKGVHCLQYIIDAEYCTIFVLYFFYCFLKLGCPTTVEGLKEVVDATFIVPPTELTRNPCKATNTFRILIMNFLLSVLVRSYPFHSDTYQLPNGPVKLLTTDSQNVLGDITNTVTEFQKEYNISLLTPDLMTRIRSLKGPSKKPNIFMGVRRGSINDDLPSAATRRGGGRRKRSQRPRKTQRRKN